MYRLAFRSLAFLFISSIFCGTPLRAEPVAVRHVQGAFHAFVVVKNLEGKRIAVGDFVQSVSGFKVTARLTFHFRDGSLDDETTVFSQQKTFRLISDHHVQNGPSFPTPSDVLINGLSGDITYHTADGDVVNDHMELPADICNGLPPVLAMNLPASMTENTVAYIAPTAKPRLVHLSIKPAGAVSFKVGGVQRSATDYIIHVEIGGLIGAIAPIIGKQPPDYHIWILGGAAPTFIREEGQFYEGGPVWRVEQVSPTFDR